MTTRAWNARLALWRTLGHASSLTRLIDRVLATRDAPLDVTRPPTTAARPLPSLTVEVERAGRSYEIDATSVRAIASNVAWLASAGGTHLGLVGNAPKRAACAGEAGQGAVLLRTEDGDLLVPFDRVRVRRNS